MANLNGVITDKTVFKIHNEEEFNKCQSYLFKQGYEWNSGSKEILKIDDITIGQSFDEEKFIIFIDNKFRVSSSTNIIRKIDNCISFNIFIRKYKFKKL